MSIRKAVIGLVVVLLGLSSLAGCSGQLPTTAATVGKSAIPTSLVENAYTGFVAAAGMNTPGKQLDPVQGATLRAKILWMMMLGNASLQIAQKENIKVPDSEIQDFINLQPELKKFAAVPSVKPYIEAFATVNVVGKKIKDQAKFAKELGSIDVKVNPRYGVWNLVAGPSPDSIVGSLSMPVPEKQPAGMGQPLPKK